MRENEDVFLNCARRCCLLHADNPSNPKCTKKRSVSLNLARRAIVGLVILYALIFVCGALGVLILKMTMNEHPELFRQYFRLPDVSLNEPKPIRRTEIFAPRQENDESDTNDADTHPLCQRQSIFENPPTSDIVRATLCHSALFMLDPCLSDVPYNSAMHA